MTMREEFDTWALTQAPMNAHQKSLARAAYAAGQRAERQRVLDVCEAEVRMFKEQAARNDGRLSDMAAGSIDTAQRVLGAIRNRKEQG